MKNSVTPISERATDGQNNAYKVLKRKDYKALFIIRQRVDRDNVEKVEDVDSSKEA